MNKDINSKSIVFFAAYPLVLATLAYTSVPYWHIPDRYRHLSTLPSQMFVQKYLLEKDTQLSEKSGFHHRTSPTHLPVPKQVVWLMLFHVPPSLLFVNLYSSLETHNAITH